MESLTSDFVYRAVLTRRTPMRFGSGPEREAAQAEQQGPTPPGDQPCLSVHQTSCFSHIATEALTSHATTTTFRSCRLTALRCPAVWSVFTTRHVRHESYQLVWCIKTKPGPSAFCNAKYAPFVICLNKLAILANMIGLIKETELTSFSCQLP